MATVTGILVQNGDAAPSIQTNCSRVGAEVLRTALGWWGVFVNCNLQIYASRNNRIRTSQQAHVIVRNVENIHCTLNQSNSSLSETRLCSLANRFFFFSSDAH